MKKSTLRLAFICFLISSISHLSLGQKQGKWDFGVSVNYGRDYYHRRYYQNILWPGTIPFYKSNFSWGGGVFVEKYLNKSWSGLAQINYDQNDVPINTLCQCGDTGTILKNKEKQHSVSFGAGLRWYFIPNSPIKYYVEGKLKADWYLATVQKTSIGNLVEWNAYGYQRLVPTFAGAFGAKWKRMALSANYEGNVARTFKRSSGPSGTNITRQGISIKAAFSFGKAH